MKGLNKYIDFALLSPAINEKELAVKIGCAIDKEYYSICTSVPRICDIFVQQPKKRKTKACCVLNFPLALNTAKSIAIEIEKTQAFTDEYDIVLPLFLITDKRWDLLNMWCKDIRNRIKVPIKGIIEIGYWDEKTIKTAASILIENKWDFIKTCTGFGPRSTTLEDIKLLKDYCGEDIKIKASAGIKTAEFAEQLIKAGADRIGTSSVL